MIYQLKGRYNNSKQKGQWKILGLGLKYKTLKKARDTKKEIRKWVTDFDIVILKITTDKKTKKIKKTIVR